LSQDLTLSLQYAGELIAAFIERAGGSVKGKISTASVPKGLEPVYIHRQSRTLSVILIECFAPRTTTSPTKSSWRSARTAWVVP
jgi:hypothetical protein